ncbi:MAG: nucleotidyltransferase family protein [Eubacterium sp.]|nr:nucleotidyltransferase family protein [Eubacterium sp.]
MNRETVSDYLLKLIRSTVRNEMPMEKPEGVSWKDLFNLAKKHQVEELAFHSIVKLNNKPEGEDYALWKSGHERNEVIDILQGEEAKLIIDETTKRNIGILPLKGIILKAAYPNPLFREMGDLDFLIEPGKVEAMDEVMKSLSYEPEDVGSEDSHDVYNKEPYLVVENHRRLLPPTEENHWYTDDIWNRLISDENNPCLKTMTATDYYLYHLLHFEKHYSMGGSGIRSIVDQYYILKSFKDQIDWDFVEDTLPKMNYVEFEKMATDLAYALFEDGEMTEELEMSKNFIMNSGTYGTFEEYRKFEIERYRKELGIKTKKGYFFRRMFMERERMEFIYPSLKKYGWLLPFFWVHRLFKSIFTNRGKVKQELKGFKEDK